MIMVIVIISNQNCLGFHGLPARFQRASGWPAVIQLTIPVHLSDNDKTFIKTLPALKVVSIYAPPLVQHETDAGQAQGISADIFCFIADQIGLCNRYLEPIDTYGSVVAHEVGERKLIAKYVKQRSIRQRTPMRLPKPFVWR